MLNHEIILNHIDDIFGLDMHAKRVLSLANATLGVIESGSLAIHPLWQDSCHHLKFNQLGALRVDSVSL